MKFKLGRSGNPALMLAVGFVLTLATSVATASPTLTTDKDDYLPGETVYLTGEGFWPSEGIDLSISIDNPRSGENIGDYAWAQFNADARGGFLATWEVPEQALDMVLVATALGLDSGLVATAIFTDHGPSPATASDFALSADGDNVVTVSVVLAGGSSSVTLTVAVARLTNTTDATDFEVALSGPGGNGNGTWSATFQGVCEKTYTFNNVQITWTTEHDHDVTRAAGASAPSTTTNDCPVIDDNNPPVITCLDPVAELGEIVGCLDDGVFGASVPVTYAFENDVVTATFSTPAGDVTVDVASVVDPDDDDLTVTVNGTASVELVKPGPAGDVITVSIDADDGQDLTRSDCDATVNGSVVYAFGGFQRPLSDSNVTRVKRGSGVPVKFDIFHCSGVEICSDLGAGPHLIDVVFNQGAAPTGDPTVDDAGAANDEGVAFRYSGICDVEDGQWIYNLKTNSTYAAGPTYKITVTLNDGATHDVFISIK